MNTGLQGCAGGCGVSFDHVRLRNTHAESPDCVCMIQPWVTGSKTGVQGCAGGCGAGLHQVGPVGGHPPRPLPARLLRHPGAPPHPGACPCCPQHTRAATVLQILLLCQQAVSRPCWSVRQAQAFDSAPSLPMKGPICLTGQAINLSLLAASHSGAARDVGLMALARLHAAAALSAPVSAV